MNLKFYDVNVDDTILEVSKSENDNIVISLRSDTNPDDYLEYEIFPDEFELMKKGIELL